MNFTLNSLMRKEVLLLLVSLFCISLASADVGCCVENIYGDYCVSGTTEGSCAGDFYEGSSCETLPECEVGCCIMADGTCGSGGSKLACDSIEDAVFNTGSCEDYDECTLGCCWLGSEYDVDMTYEECLVKYEDSGLTPNFEEGISLEQCYSFVAAEEKGCCVGLDGCMYDSAEMCDEMDTDTGYGFYPNQYCTDVGDYLVDGGFEAFCECEPTDEVFCDGGDLYAVDSCGFEDGLIESCPESCSEIAGGCVTSACEDTFSFPSSTVFGDFNSYDVYYQDFSDVWQKKEFTLGGKRKSGEMWCVYEGPVGSFRDRPGTQHYIAGCVDGDERLLSCGSAREEVCVAGYDLSNEMFTASCEVNNFGTYYGQDYHGSGDTNEIAEQYFQPMDDPVENSDGSLGVSSIPTATNDCSLASFTCEVVYGDQNTGWEVYINSLCLRPDFSMMAADYCSSRGDCGLDINILGETGEVDGFDISRSTSGVGSAYVGYGESCFEQNDHDEDGIADWLQVSCDNKDYDYCDDDGPCTFFDENKITSDPDHYYSPNYFGVNYYDYIENLVGVVDDLFTNHMIPYYFTLEQICDYSGFCYSPGYLETTNVDCRNVHTRVSSITKNLGFNVGGTQLHDDLMDCSILPYYYEDEENREDYCVIDYEEKLFEFYNVFRTIKPWIFNEQVFHTYSLQEDVENWNIDIQKFVVYLGEENCGTMASEFQHSYDDGDVKKVDIGFECKYFVGPSDNKCNLCNETIDNGGLIFTKDGEEVEGFSQASYCNEYRCRSLGEDCIFVEEKEGVEGGYCVEEACDDLYAPDIDIFQDVLDEQGYSASVIDEDGYTVEDISFTLFEFGVVTDKLSECLFVPDTAAAELWERYDVENWDELPWSMETGDETYEQALYDELKNMADVYVSPEDETLDDHHSMTRSIQNSGEELIYYVFCENICGANNALTHYQINLIAGEIPPSDFPKNYVYVLPESGSQLPNGQGTYEVDIRMDREASCKYSTTEPIDYASMVDEFTVCSPYDEDEYGMLGEFECSVHLPLETGTNSFYFWCEDVYGNSWESYETWSVSVTDPLEISYVYPSGNTLYYNDVEMQVNTDVGGDNGNAVCGYKRADWVSYVDFLNTGTSLHTQTLEDLSAANYEYAIKCEDEVGNVAEDEITFTIAVDSDAPEIENVYYLGSTLYVITDEVAMCEYSDTSFTFGNGVEMAGTGFTSHSFTVGDYSEYHILCQDEFANVGSEMVVAVGFE